MNAPDASIGAPPSEFRHAPVASKFSSARPNGSNRAWQFAHAGLTLWAVIRSRRVPRGWPGRSASAGTLAGGLGASMPKKRVSTYTPRTVGDVRDGCETTVNGPACPRRPARFVFGHDTRTNSLPLIPDRP